MYTFLIKMNEVSGITISWPGPPIDLDHKLQPPISSWGKMFMPLRRLCTESFASEFQFESRLWIGNLLGDSWWLSTMGAFFWRYPLGRFLFDVFGSFSRFLQGMNSSVWSCGMIEALLQTEVFHERRPESSSVSWKTAVRIVSCRLVSLLLVLLNAPFWWNASTAKARFASFLCHTGQCCFAGFLSSWKRTKSQGTESRSAVVWRIACSLQDLSQLMHFDTYFWKPFVEFLAKIPPPQLQM